MERNFLLVYSTSVGGQAQYRYFTKKEDMKDYIKELYSIKLGNTDKRYWKVLHKYEIKEVK